MISTEAVTNLVDHLVTFNQGEIERRFNESSVECEICLNLKTGEYCARLNCGHIFCRACLNGYFDCLISEG